MKEKDQKVVYEEEPPSESDKPPSYIPQPVKPWRVAVIANVKGETALPFDAPADAGAESDRKETIQAIQARDQMDGHQTIFFLQTLHYPLLYISTNLISVLTSQKGLLEMPAKRTFRHYWKCCAYPTRHHASWLMQLRWTRP